MKLINLEKEKKYLDLVLNVLDSEIKKSSDTLDKSKENINSLKRFMWENISQYTDAERGIALSEADHLVDLTNRSIISLEKLKAAKNSPYFAKIIFEDEYGTMPIYIGVSTIERDGDFFVFDWRTPISSLYYNYDLGPAMYQAPLGKIHGKITEKVQFKIVDGEMVRALNTQFNIDDEFLQEILSNSSSNQMKNIVSTIQIEQNKIIRSNPNQNIIVQGYAGSGKTSVAIHRIAYLLYKNRNMTSDNILIISPNDIFSGYISNVLPELGEKNPLVTTFSDIALNFLKPFKSIESYSDFLDRVYSSENVNHEDITYKMSDKIYNDILLFFEKYNENIEFYTNLREKNHVVPKENIKKMFDRYKKFSLRERLDLVADDICAELYLPSAKCASHVKKNLIEHSNLELNMMNLYEQFLNEQNISYTKNKKICFEDIAPLIEMSFFVNGFENYNHIAHFVLDEAQDYNTHQLKIINRIFNNATVTILGDIYQTLNPYKENYPLEELKHLFENSQYIELKNSYRSSEEIIEYTKNVLDIDDIVAVRNHNYNKVDLKKVVPTNLIDNILQDFEESKRASLNTNAIITKDKNDAIELYSYLKNYIDIDLIKDADSKVQKKNIIIPSYLSKGLEFDNVIIFNDLNNPFTENEKFLYYVASTRAQHKLTIYNEPLIKSKGYSRTRNNNY